MANEITPTLTRVDAAKEALMDTIADHHEDFYRDRPFVKVVSSSVNRIIQDTRLEEAQKLMNEKPAAAYLAAIELVKSKHRDELPVVDALGELEQEIRKLLPEVG